MHIVLTAAPIPVLVGIPVSASCLVRDHVGVTDVEL